MNTQNISNIFAGRGEGGGLTFTDTTYLYTADALSALGREVCAASRSG